MRVSTYHIGSRADLHRVLDACLPGGALHAARQPPLLILDLRSLAQA